MENVLIPLYKLLLHFAIGSQSSLTVGIAIGVKSSNGFGFSKSSPHKSFLEESDALVSGVLDESSADGGAHKLFSTL